MSEIKKKILTIEAIRGIAAIYVMLGHIVLFYKPYTFFPKYEFITKTVFGFGHQAVLLFFIVSGFSITYSSWNLEISDTRNLKDYFFKRFRRIYPLFLIALILSLLVLSVTGSESDLKRNILSFFFLTDNATGSILDPIPTNYPIWSLSYEVIYYLLYPLMLFFWNKIGQKKTFAFVLVTGIASGITGFSGWPNHIFNVWQYYWIWMAGAILANSYLKRKKFRVSYFYGLLISSAGFMLTIEKIPVVRDWFWSLFFINIFVAFYLEEDIQVRYRNRLINYIIGIASLSVCYYLTYFKNIVFHSDLIKIILITLGGTSSIIFFLTSNSLRRTVKFLLAPFIRTGAFSYALYIIHWPLIMLFVFLFNKFAAVSLFNLSLLILFNIMVILLLSWYLEERLQPHFANVLNRWYYKR